MEVKIDDNAAGLQLAHVEKNTKASTRACNFLQQVWYVRVNTQWLHAGIHSDRRLDYRKGSQSQQGCSANKQGCTRNLTQICTCQPHCWTLVFAHPFWSWEIICSTRTGVQSCVGVTPRRRISPRLKPQVLDNSEYTVDSVTFKNTDRCDVVAHRWSVSWMSKHSLSHVHPVCGRLTSAMNRTTWAQVGFCDDGFTNLWIKAEILPSVMMLEMQVCVCYYCVALRKLRHRSWDFSWAFATWLAS